jgi:hypothetical protein
MVFLKSLSYVSKNYKSKKNKERRKSDSQISYVYYENYEEEPMKISRNNSFDISMDERQYFRSGSEMIMYNQENNECSYSYCITCKNRFPKNTNKFCSLQCYKISKKDCNGVYHIKCKLCNKIFETKCIFTDYCSDYIIHISRVCST